MTRARVITAVTAIYIFIGLLHEGYVVTHPHGLDQSQRDTMAIGAVFFWPLVDVLALAIVVTKDLP